MLMLMASIIPIIFAFLVIYGALSDLARFKIPNFVSYGLVLLFILQSFSQWMGWLPQAQPSPPLSFHVAITAVVFIVAVVFWRRGHIGGGDVKYLAATTLWMGPLGVIPFMVLLSGLALVMALLLKLSANWGFLIHAGNLPVFVKRLYAKFEEKQIPYGFPIGLAALIMIPSIFKS